MKAIGFKESLSINQKDSFIEFETEIEAPKGHDILVKVEATSVNPVDFKVRQNAAKDTVLSTPKIIGWDAVGVVEAIGEAVKNFKIGDKVYYAGDITRNGSNAEYQLVDERIVGFKPKSCTNAEAAAMPLTTLTAYESIFDRIKYNDANDAGKTILILAGAGGVGSIAIQLAKKLTNLKVIATASRKESIDWCLQLGADHVVNHRDLKESLKSIEQEQIDYILDFVDLEGYWDLIADLIKPQGHIVSITGSNTPLSLDILKSKSVTFCWEFMYTRSMYTTKDMQRQGDILNHVSELLEQGVILSTLTTILKGFTVENIKKSHELQESGRSIGKTVIDY